MRLLNVDQILTPKDEIQLFDGEYSGFQRYDYIRHPKLDQIFERMRGDFWVPQEISMGNDASGITQLPDSVQEVFRANLLFQTCADSLVTRGVHSVLAERASDPVMEKLAIQWAYQELIHSDAYSHIIRSVYPDPTALFDIIAETPEITNRFDKENAAFSMEGDIEDMLLNLMALEAGKFMMSFLITYHINDTYPGMIPGSTQIIRLIQHDETNHMIASAEILKIIAADPKEAGLDSSHQRDKYESIFAQVLKDEMSWARYLLSLHNFTELQEKDLEQFMRWALNRALKAAKLPTLDGGEEGTLARWFLHTSDINKAATAAQETELTSYRIGRMKRDW